MVSSDFKARALEALRGNWFVSIIAGMLASMLGGTTMGFTGVSINVEYRIDGGTETPDGGVIAMIRSISQNQLPQGDSAYSEYAMSVFGILLIGLLISAIVSLIIGSGVGIGYSQFNLDMLRGDKPKFATVFSGFDRLKTGIAAHLLIFIRVLIGMIFFLIPGILMAYSYSMVNYVIAENPDMNAREALRESKRIMKGYRWRLFCLSLSFIGWAILGVLTLGIAFIWVIPYQQAAIAALYEEAKRNA